MQIAPTSTQFTDVFIDFSPVGDTHGSGVYIGLDPWRMYCVEWKTRKARPARKSREESRPATGRSRNPVHAAGGRETDREIRRGRLGREGVGMRGNEGGGRVSCECRTIFGLKKLVNYMAHFAYHHRRHCLRMKR